MATTQGPIQMDLFSVQKDLVALNKRISEKLNDAYRKAFAQNASGPGSKFSDWGRGQADTTANRLKRSLVSSGFSGGKRLSALSLLYEKAWERKYEYIISKYKAAQPDGWSLSGLPYRERPYAQGKRMKKKKGRDARHRLGQAKVRYTTEALSTGFLRESIRRGFRAGGNRYVKVTNALLQGGFAIDLTEYDLTTADDGYDIFARTLFDIGVLPGSFDDGDFTDFLDEDWERIATRVRAIIDEEFVGDVLEIFGDINERI